MKSLVGGGGGSGSGSEEPEFLCDHVISTATGNWLSHLDWDGHRCAVRQVFCLESPGSFKGLQLGISARMLVDMPASRQCSLHCSQMSCTFQKGKPCLGTHCRPQPCCWREAC